MYLYISVHIYILCNNNDKWYHPSKHLALALNTCHIFPRWDCTSFRAFVKDAYKNVCAHGLRGISFTLLVNQCSIPLSEIPLTGFSCLKRIIWKLQFSGRGYISWIYHHTHHTLWNTFNRNTAPINGIIGRTMLYKPPMGSLIEWVRNTTSIKL